VVLVVSSLSSALTAWAVTATVSGGPTFTATATTATILKRHTAAKTLSCTGSTASGAVAASTTGILPTYVGTVTAAFTSATSSAGSALRCPVSPRRSTSRP
jgi:hypothetical protein